MAEMYLLDWRTTKASKAPTPEQVDYWLQQQGLAPEGRTRVWANGDVQVSCATDPTERWPDFAPLAIPIEDQLGGHVKALLLARKELLDIPPSQRTATDRALLATMALLMFGYGVSDA